MFETSSNAEISQSWTKPKYLKVEQMNWCAVCIRSPFPDWKKKKKKGKERKDSSYGDPETKKMEIREILTLSVSGRFEDPWSWSQICSHLATSVSSWRSFGVIKDDLTSVFTGRTLPATAQRTVKKTLKSDFMIARNWLYFGSTLDRYWWWQRKSVREQIVYDTIWCLL